ncbi:hypothetical protein DFJ74DRAFT_707622 [Hyaloraphidium curvatum]|nr:hypothetical protein DFJ74DRAFT_707622 [Hyaloraphidium curvatum]
MGPATLLAAAVGLLAAARGAAAVRYVTVVAHFPDCSDAIALGPDSFQVFVRSTGGCDYSLHSRNYTHGLSECYYLGGPNGAQASWCTEFPTTPVSGGFLGWAYPLSPADLKRNAQDNISALIDYVHEGDCTVKDVERLSFRASLFATCSPPYQSCPSVGTQRYPRACGELESHPFGNFRGAVLGGGGGGGGGGKTTARKRTTARGTSKRRSTSKRAASSKRRSSTKRRTTSRKRTTTKRA